MGLLGGTPFDNDAQILYLFVTGLEAYTQAKVIPVVPKTLVEAMEMAWVYLGKHRTPVQINVAVPEGYGSHGKMPVAA